MKQRLITAGIGLAIFFPFVFLSHTYLWEIFAAVLSFLGVFELLRALKVLNKWEISVPSLVYSLIMPLFFARDSRSLFDATILYLCLVLMFTMIVNRRVAPEKVCFAAVFAIYITCAFTSLVTVRRLPLGENVFFMIFAGAWISDSAAYFVGLAFGSHPLCPKLSPKKTVEGAIGGLFGGMAAVLIYGLIADLISPKSFNYLSLVFVGAVIGVVSQFGDLLCSAIKRRVDIKDFSDILPGHGGILDRFDSVMAVSLFVAFLFTRITIVY
ncbi:MAG: CDP-archaeol synthase [Clostridia bacterium]|nr:CDP-archaeol synthase [Clostridia bacterium]